MGTMTQIGSMIVKGAEGFAIGVGIAKLSTATGAWLARRIYPRSTYHELSTAQKVVNVFAMAALGASVGALVDGCLLSWGVWAVTGNFPPSPAVSYSISGAIGAWGSLLHDPTLGAILQRLPYGRRM